MAEIIKTDEEEDKVEVDRWQNCGKDRLYINKLGKSWDNTFLDLGGDEGHSMNAKTTVKEESDGRIVLERKTGWDGNHEYKETVIQV